MIQWNAVTWYSKLGAIIFFIGVLPALSFCLGSYWQEAREDTSYVPPVVGTSLPKVVTTSTQPSSALPKDNQAVQKSPAAPAAREKLIISFGQSFGECIGYCESEITVTETITDFSARGWNDEPLPPVTGQAATDVALWRSLVLAVNTKEIGSLPDEVGCPDCDDGGARWISVSRVSSSLPQETLFFKKVSFEFDNPPVELKPLVDLLAPVRTELSKRFNDYVLPE